MIYHNEYEKLYLEWMYTMVCGEEYGEYKRLFDKLYDTTFYYVLPMDQNREADGRELRYIYGHEHGLSDEEIQEYLDTKPCTVLEMLIAFVRRYEFQVTYDTEEGDRTSLWWWIIVTNMGLNEFTDSADWTDEDVDYILDNFMERKFNPDGSGGGPFILPGTDKDLRTIDFWSQMNLFMTDYIRSGEVLD